MSFGKKPKQPAPPDPVPLPDPENDAVRKRAADAMKSLLTRRGRARTLLSGRTGDQSSGPARGTIISRAAKSQ